MKRTLAVAVLAAAISLQAAAPSLSAAEPLVGTWRLESQEINGQKGESEPLAFKVSQAGDKYSFAFSVLINELYVVTMKYALRLDGSAADILSGSDEKMGTIQMTRSGGSQYTLVMKGPNRPDSKGKLTVSADGKTLISEADAVLAGRSTHSRQTFSRYQ